MTLHDGEKVEIPKEIHRNIAVCPVKTANKIISFFKIGRERKFLISYSCGVNKIAVGMVVMGRIAENFGAGSGVPAQDLNKSQSGAVVAVYAKC